MHKPLLVRVLLGKVYGCSAPWYPWQQAGKRNDIPFQYQFRIFVPPALGVGVGVPTFGRGGGCKQMQVRRSLESKPVVKEGILCAHVSIVNYRVLPSEDNLVPQHHLANSLWQ